VSRYLSQIAHLEINSQQVAVGFFIERFGLGAVDEEGVSHDLRHGLLDPASKLSRG